MGRTCSHVSGRAAGRKVAVIAFPHGKERVFASHLSAAPRPRPALRGGLNETNRCCFRSFVTALLGGSFAGRDWGGAQTRGGRPGVCGGRLSSPKSHRRLPELPKAVCGPETSRVDWFVIHVLFLLECTLRKTLPLFLLKNFEKRHDLKKSLISFSFPAASRSRTSRFSAHA